MSAYTEGRRAGRLLLAPGLNPYMDSDLRSVEWNLGWCDASREEVLRRDTERRARNGVEASGCWDQTS